MRVIFKKACIYNKHQRFVGNITTLNEDTAQKAIKEGLVKPYEGVFPPNPKKKTKMNLKDLK